jgi:YegS/Rv2252/BmrU family lipid kinase
MRDILVILNPAARSERAGRTWKKIETFRGAKVKLTKAPGEARALAAWGVEQGYHTIVAAGGDGTINEVVNGLVGSTVKLGILPVGTMNVFAAELGLPADLAKAWEIVVAGHTRKIDLARANQQYFVQLAGVGLDAQVVQETTWTSKKTFGPLSYLASAVQIAARTPPRLVISSGDVEREGSFVLVGNGRYYGAAIEFFHDARLDDGLLDVLIFKNLGYLDIARYLAGVVMGRHTKLDDVEYFQTKKVVVWSGDQVPLEVDGELAGVLPVTFRISSRKLRVVVAKYRAS